MHLVGGKSGTMRYRLPRGVSCEHCVVQWYWATANSCAPRGFLEYMHAMDAPFGRTCESDGGGLGGFRDDMEQCDANRVPEEFWSCADVSIGQENRKPSEEGSSVLEKEGGDEEDSSAGGGGNNGSNVWGNGLNNENNDGGKCVRLMQKCDGLVPCCNPKAVCAYDQIRRVFACRHRGSFFRK